MSERGRIGFQQPGNGSRRYCCTESLAADIGCTVERPIISFTAPLGSHSVHPWTAEVSFQGAGEVAVAKDAAVEVEHTGMYHLWFLTCDAHLGTARVEGHTAWKNPNGYLPGMMAPNLPFFAAMSVSYVCLSLAWLTACALAWRHVIPLQHCISVVLLLGMAEMLTWYMCVQLPLSPLRCPRSHPPSRSDFSEFNATGFRPYTTTVLAVLLGALRKSLSRMLLLVAAMGFGIVRPTLGEAAWRVAALGLSYFAVSCGLDVTTHVGTVDDLTKGARIAYVAPVAALDATFILWTFTALSATLSTLAARRAAAPKMALYTKFTSALAAAVVVSIAWIGYEMWYKITDAHNAHWRSDWITAAFWHVLSLLLIAAMAFTWRPGDAVERFVSEHGVEGEADSPRTVLGDRLQLSAGIGGAAPAKSS